MDMRKTKSQAGFSLIELLVSIAILVTIVGVTAQRARGRPTRERGCRIAEQHEPKPSRVVVVHKPRFNSGG